jgi:hypothetical protein
MGMCVESGRVFMTGTFLGIGTREYGQREVQPDGSFVTTKFLVIFFLPVWPLGTRRVRQKVRENMNVVKVSRYVVHRLPLCWPQVLGVMAGGWGIFLCCIAFLVLIWRSLTSS